MADTKKPQKDTYAVTSAFVWDKAIKKPGDKVELTAAEAHGLKARGKIEEPTAKPASKKAAATDAAKSGTAAAPKAPA
ncbi:hypothetical protein [Tritonibacter mobilis]|uniref:hypothetical protein n=1 Tax=Tritonibacter mobilis TaxID=379347 RepID=UPI0008068831|nr:hypothetical protein [Tritonibacter mobilis]GLP86295.1 hypothetical protein GCM10007921_18550 [Tritonibacter mobilis]SDX16659.1 hypothetical protein SAMN05444385_105168 [Tritonibacter mobilis]